MKVLEFTHAAQLVPIYVNPQYIIGYMRHSDDSKTILILQGGGEIQVLESIADFKEKLEKYRADLRKEFDAAIDEAATSGEDRA